VQAKLRPKVGEWFKKNNPDLSAKWEECTAEWQKNVAAAKINEDPAEVRWPLPAKEICEDPTFKELWFNYTTVDRQLAQLKSHSALNRAAQMLRVLGFDDAAQQRSTNALSGGLRMRVALCCAFFIEPDVLLLVRVGAIFFFFCFFLSDRAWCVLVALCSCCVFF
jgi:hypothetical protein